MAKLETLIYKFRNGFNAKRIALSKLVSLVFCVCGTRAPIYVLFVRFLYFLWCVLFLGVEKKGEHFRNQVYTNSCLSNQQEGPSIGR